MDDVPEELLATVTPPKELRQELETKPLCGGRFEVSWANGPLRGKRTTTYCAEPFCIQTGRCTGAKFVAHSIQHDSDGSVRRLDPREVVPAARESARRATGKDDPRSDREIRAFCAMVYSRLGRALRGEW